MAPLERRRQLLGASTLMMAGCALVTDLGYEVGGEGGSAASLGAGAGLPTSTGTSGAPTSSGGGEGQGAGGPGPGSTGTAGGDGQGGGGGGGSGCTLEGDGSGTPLAHARVIGPVRGALERYPDAAAVLDGERIVFVSPMVASEDSPVTLDGAPLLDAGARAVVLGWADEDGSAAAAWPLAQAPLATFTYPSFDVASVGTGRVVVATTHAPDSFRLIEVDLCTREETVIASCGEGTVQSAQVETDAEGRMAFSFNNGGTNPVCPVLPPGCPQPVTGVLDTAVWLVDTDGTCSATTLRGSDEPGGATSYQTAVKLALDGATVNAIGNYDLARFSGEAAIDTGQPAEVYDYFLARLRPSGGQLAAIDAWDLGRLVFFGDKAVAIAGAGASRRTLAAFTVASDVAPRGPFAGGATIEPAFAGSEVLLVGLGTDTGALQFARWLGGNGADGVHGLTATDAGVIVAGRHSSGDASLGACSDGVQENAGGCAYFARVGAGGEVTPALQVVESAAAGTRTTDIGLVGLARPAGVWGVGVSTGEVSVSGRAIAAPPGGTSNVYVAFGAD